MWQRWTRRALLLDWILLDPSIVRINASFTDVNALGAYLASVLTVVVALTVAARRVEAKVAGAVSAAAIVGATVFTASRAAWAGMVAGTAVMVVGLLVWRLPSWPASAYRAARMAVISVMVVFALGLVGATAWATARDARIGQRHSYVNVMLHTLNLRATAEERLRGRVQFWAAATRMVGARPWAGVGIGRYFKEVYRWAPNQAALVRKQENAHNYYLQLAAETGLPAVAAFLALLGAGLTAGLRVCRSQAPREARLIALGAACGILAFSLSLLTGHSLLLHEGQVTFWPLVALALLTCHEWCGKKPLRWAWWGRVASVAVPLAAAALVVTLPARLAGSIPLQDVRVSGLLEDADVLSGIEGDWTGGRATIDLPATARGATIVVRFAAPVPQTIDVSLDGRPVERVSGVAGQRLQLRYLIPRVVSRTTFRSLDLVVSPTWAPDGTRQELGVIVESVHWMP